MKVVLRGKEVSLAEFCEKTGLPRERVKSWMRSGRLLDKTAGWVDATGTGV